MTLLNNIKIKENMNIKDKITIKYFYNQYSIIVEIEYLGFS